MRIAELSRKTKETDIALKLTLEGTGRAEIDTGIGFFDHMLTAFAFHGGFDLTLYCKGDLEVDGHHTVEDCGIVLGAAFKQALSDKRGISRFGSFYIPMDEALSFACVDISGRPFLAYEEGNLPALVQEGFNTSLMREFLRAFSDNAGVTLHVRLLAGVNAHHMLEAAFKALARALRQAIAITGDDLPSSKGLL